MTATALQPGRGQMDRVRVVIAEDSVLLREGIARLLEEPGFEIAGQAGDGRRPGAQSRRAQAQHRLIDIAR